MRLVSRWPVSALLMLLALGLCTPGRAAVSNHLYRGQILQGQVYNDPNQTTPLYLFVFQVETDGSVGMVDFVTAAGQTFSIPADEYTTSDEVDTYHWVDGATHIWEYWGYFEDPNALDAYGDGWYTAILDYVTGDQDETAVWFGIPDTNVPIPAPTQKPELRWPTQNGSATSPVAFSWAPLTDPNAGDIYTGVLNEDDKYVITDVYDVNATDSQPYDVNEGQYEIEFAFESFFATTNVDGIPFDVLKTNTLVQSFEVAASSVYRFWSPVTGRHFYTIDPNERDKLIRDYSEAWTFEGPVFHAWTTQRDPNLAPVYRFWSPDTSSHFYTISDRERDKLVTDYSDVWTYEGIAFYAYAPDSQPADTSPVYRFWKPSDNTHFYTSNPDEVDKLTTEYAEIYTFEDIAFYVWP